MPKPPQLPSVENSPSIVFIDFWKSVANGLGSSRLRINPEAGNIHELLSADSDARPYLHDAIIKSYKLSHCQHLRSPIALEIVLDILGEAAYDLHGNKADDLFDIELLEEIAWHISHHYADTITGLVHNKSEQGTNAFSRATVGETAQLVSFPDYKIRKSNSLL